MFGKRIEGSSLKEEAVEEEDDLDNLPLPHAVNPDDLTHISVYRDNTTDIKELKELALKAKQAATTSTLMPSSLPSTTTAALPTPRIFKATHIKALAALQSIQRKLGRDGTGPNHTVSSFKLANGDLFFLERQLDTSRDVYEFVGVDLQNISTDEDKSSQGKLLIRGEACLVTEESCLLHEVRMVEKLGLSPRHRSIVQYLDIVSYFLPFLRYEDLMITVWPYSEVTLTQIAPLIKDELLAIFFSYHSLLSLNALHAQRISHNQVSPSCFCLKGASSSSGNSMLEWSSHFERDGGKGWHERGLYLRALERCTPLSTSSPDYTKLSQTITLLTTNKTPTWNSLLWMQVTSALQAGNEQAVEVAINALSATLEAPDPAKHRTSLKSLLTKLEIALLQ